MNEWLQKIRETIFQHETIANPDDYSLGEVLLSYLELRKADREFWEHRAQTKDSLKDLQAILNAISFLKERELDTVYSLGEYLSRTGARMNELRAVQAELDELKTVRYWIRKVIPDALTTPTESSKPSLYETMEIAHNKNDLTNLMEQTASGLISSQRNRLLLVKCDHHINSDKIV